MLFFDILFKKMEEQNVSSYKLQKKLGISTSTISNWKTKSNKDMNLSTALKLAKYFNISLDNIIELEQHEVLTDKEKELIEQYNKADKTTQEIVDKILNIKTKSNFKYSSLKEENKLA